MKPRAVNPDGTPKASDDWTLVSTLVQEGASLGANSTIRCGVTIGRWAMVGAGSVVTREVPDYGLVWGNPAQLRGFVGPNGERLQELDRNPGVVLAGYPGSDILIEIPVEIWETVK